MNVSISANYAEIQKDIISQKETAAKRLKLKLDAIFRDKISTPEQVIKVYAMLAKYKSLSGNDYKITFEENTIV